MLVVLLLALAFEPCVELFSQAVAQVRPSRSTITYDARFAAQAREFFAVASFHNALRFEERFGVGTEVVAARSPKRMLCTRLMPMFVMRCC